MLFLAGALFCNKQLINQRLDRLCEIKMRPKDSCTQFCTLLENKNKGISSIAVRLEINVKKIAFGNEEHTTD